MFTNFAVDQDDDSLPAAGFNFDGRFSAASDPLGCKVSDRTSDLDADQNECVGCQGGVDNVLPRLVAALDAIQPPKSTPLRQLFDAATKAGDFVLLLRLSGVDSLVNSSPFTATFFHGLSSAKACTHIGDGNGQFLVTDDSLLVAGALDQPRWTAPAQIVNGRLRVQIGSLTGLPAPIPPGLVQQAQLRANLNPSGRIGTKGNFGAALNGTALRDLLATEMEEFRTMLNAILPKIADLHDASGSCSRGFGEPCNLGVGLRFKLMHAVIDGTTSATSRNPCH